MVLGLGTGNYRAAAELKLGHVDLWRRFVDGGFAYDAEDRVELIAAGLRRVSAHAGGEITSVWVVGDSLHDVSAAKANGLRVLGVGTGRCGIEALVAAGADVTLP